MRADERGWVPVEIALDQCPALVPDASVRWLKFGSTRLTEPFFQHTVLKLKRGKHRPREIDTDLAAVIAEGTRWNATAPAAFIFHVSRCGSSLVANGLRMARGIQVLAEARPMTSLFLPYPATGYAYSDNCWCQRRSALAGALVSLFSHYRASIPEPIVIKWTSLNTIMMSDIRALWPETPCLFVVRNPLEVLVANLQPGGLIDSRRSPAGPALCRCSHARLARMSDEEYGARLIGHYLDTALATSGDNFWIIDYDDIDQPTLGMVADRFGLKLPRSAHRLKAVFEHHAKDPEGTRRFRDDRLAKRRLATAPARRAVEQWATPAYRSLLAGSNRVR